jgi:CheY-like chemotaxis protein
MMPEVDGWETYHRLRAIPALRNIPVLFLAAAPPEWIYPKAQRIGIAGYVYEPSGPQALLAACEAVSKGDTYYPTPLSLESQTSNLKLQVSKLAGFATRHVSFVIFLAFLILYTATLMPDVLPADSGEFQRVAASAGLAHPPGYPLYTMLGWLFTKLPLGPSLAWRVSFFSALTAAATVALVFQTARRMTGSIWSGLVAALMLGSATTFWATGTQASIRPLTAFFVALCVYALVEYKLQVANRQPLIANRRLTLFALALSLGFTHHYASMAFPAVPFIIYLVLADPTLLRQPRRWLKPAVAFALGLLVLLYLPLRGSPDLNLTAPSGFLHYFLGLGFEGDMFAVGLFDRLAIFPTLLHFQFNGVLLLAAIIGAVLLLWRDRKLALLLVGSFVVHTIIVLTYRAPQTVEYMMPAYVPLALLAAIPFKAIPNLQSHKFAGLHVCKFAATIAVLVAGVANLIIHLPSYVTLSQSHDAREYAETLLQDAPADAIVLSNWHWFTPLRYLQEVEGLRPDVSVEYVYPQGRSLAKNVIDRIEAHISQRPVIVTDYYEQEYSQLPYRFEPLGQAFLVRAQPNFAPPNGLRPLGVTLGEQVALLGYRLESNETEPSRPLMLTLAWSPTVTPAVDLSLFAQLIGPDGQLWSAALDSRHTAGHLLAEEIIVERFVIYPLLQAPPDDYGLTVGAYTSSGRLATREGAQAVRLTTVHLRPSTLRPVTSHATLVRFDGGPTLIGIDYDTGVPGQVRAFLHWAGPGTEADLQLLDGSGAVIGRNHVPALARGQYATVSLDLSGFPKRIVLLDGDRPRHWNLLFGGGSPLPSGMAGERYVPFGDSLMLVGLSAPRKDPEPGVGVTLGLHFLGRRPLERDYVVSTALVGLNPDRTWAWRADEDSVPALGAIPTLKWIRDSTIYDPHQLIIPNDAPQLPIEGTLVIYDHFTQAPLPPLDGRFHLPPTIPLGVWTVVIP